MSSIDPNAASARENARQGDGRFGEQGHTRADNVDLPTGPAGDREQVETTIGDLRVGDEIVYFDGNQTVDHLEGGIDWNGRPIREVYVRGVDTPRTIPAKAPVTVIRDTSDDGMRADEGAHPLTTGPERLMDAKRGHALVPASARNWPSIGATEDTPVAEKPIQARYFGPSGQEWLVAELDQDTGEAFGYCDLGMGYPEWGYLDMHELAMTRHPGFPNARHPAIERDLDFTPGTPFAQHETNDERGY